MRQKEFFTWYSLLKSYRYQHHGGWNIEGTDKWNRIQTPEIDQQYKETQHLSKQHYQSAGNDGAVSQYLAMWNTYIKLDYFSHCIQHLTQYVKGLRCKRQILKNFQKKFLRKKPLLFLKRLQQLLGEDASNTYDQQGIITTHKEFLKIIAIKDSLGEKWAKHLGRFFISRMSNNHIFKCSNLLVNREININTTISIIFLPLV